MEKGLHREDEIQRNIVKKNRHRGEYLIINVLKIPTGVFR